jgi:hypothetical protein
MIIRADRGVRAEAPSGVDRRIATIGRTVAAAGPAPAGSATGSRTVREADARRRRQPRHRAGDRAGPGPRGRAGVRGGARRRRPGRAGGRAAWRRPRHGRGRRRHRGGRQRRRRRRGGGAGRPRRRGVQRRQVVRAHRRRDGRRRPGPLARHEPVVERPGGAAGHRAAGHGRRRRDRAGVVDLGPRGRRLARLQRRQGRRHRAGQGAGPRPRRAAHPGQHHRPRLDLVPRRRLGSAPAGRPRGHRRLRRARAALRSLRRARGGGRRRDVPVLGARALGQRRLFVVDGGQSRAF